MVEAVPSGQSESGWWAAFTVEAQRRLGHLFRLHGDHRVPRPRRWSRKARKAARRFFRWVAKRVPVEHRERVYPRQPWPCDPRGADRMLQHLDWEDYWTGETARVAGLYVRVDAALRAGEFGVVDRELAGVDVAGESVVVLLGWLSATLPAEERLSSRAGFYRAVAERLVRERGEEAAAGLLAGLAGGGG